MKKKRLLFTVIEREQPIVSEVVLFMSRLFCRKFGSRELHAPDYDVFPTQVKFSDYFALGRSSENLSRARTARSLRSPY